MEILNGADLYYRVAFYIGIGAFSIFVVQSLLTIFGGDFSDGVDADFDGDLHGHSGPMQMFTFRSLVNFLLGFSWTALALYHTISNKIILSSIATVAGAVLVMLVLFMMRQLQNMAQNNTMKIESAIGKTAHVYLTIPANQSGKGKVHINIQDTLRELDAMTNGEMLPTNSIVVVEEIIQNSILLVKKIQT